MMLMMMIFTCQVFPGHFEPCFDFGSFVCLGSVVGHAETYHEDDDEDDFNDGDNDFNDE